MRPGSRPGPQWAWLLAALWPLLAHAAAPAAAAAPRTGADPATAAQRRMAVGLAVAHVRAEYRRFPQMALPGVDFDHPQVLARRAASGRRLIFVSFDSKLPQWGEYVTFEVCAHLARIVRIDGGKVADIGLYRRTVSTIDVATPNRLPSGCQSAHG